MENGLVYVSRPLYSILAIWTKFGPIFVPKWAKFDLLHPVFQFFIQDLYSGPLIVWKSVLVCTSSSFCSNFAFWTKFGPIFGQNEPNLTFYIRYSIFSCKLYTQGFKLCGKMVLFASLGLLISICLYGPILDLLGPKYPNEPWKPQLFSGPQDFTYP